MISSSTFQRNLSLASSCGIAALQIPLSEAPNMGISGKSCEGRRRGTRTEEEAAAAALGPVLLPGASRVAAGSSVGLEAAGGTTDEALASSWEGTPQSRV